MQDAASPMPTDGLAPEADVAVEQARFLEIQDELDRKAKLVDSQAVSEATVRRLQLRVDAQRATVDAVQAREAIVAAKKRRRGLPVWRAVRIAVSTPPALRPIATSASAAVWARPWPESWVCRST